VKQDYHGAICNYKTSSFTRWIHRGCSGDWIGWPLIGCIGHRYVWKWSWCFKCGRACKSTIIFRMGWSLECWSRSIFALKHWSNVKIDPSKITYDWNLESSYLEQTWSVTHGFLLVYPPNKVILNPARVFAVGSARQVLLTLIVHSLIEEVFAIRSRNRP